MKARRPPCVAPRDRRPQPLHCAHQLATELHRRSHPFSAGRSSERRCRNDAGSAHDSPDRTKEVGKMLASDERNRKLGGSTPTIILGGAVHSKPCVRSHSGSAVEVLSPDSLSVRMVTAPVSNVISSSANSRPMNRGHAKGREEFRRYSHDLLGLGRACLSDDGSAVRINCQAGKCSVIRPRRS